MTTELETTIDLRRIEPSRNMRRFYVLAIQPTLFGGVSVIRNWGRIGSSGQIKIDTYEDDDQAKAWLSKIASAKRRKGYQVRSSR